MKLTAAILIFVAIGGASATPQQSAPEAQGRTDRQSFEEWLQELSPAQRQGADFWAAQRSTPAPISCLATDNATHPEFVAGCQEAQRRLALPDVRRRTEPGYRRGWNTDVAAAAAPISASTGSAPQLPPDLVSSSVGTPLSQIKANFPSLDCSSTFCEFDKGQVPQSFCPQAGTCDHLVLFHDGSKIVGWRADVSARDWSKSLAATRNRLGSAEESTIGPSGLLRIRFRYWTWKLKNGNSISYTEAIGRNMYGKVVDDRTISVGPP